MQYNNYESEIKWHLIHEEEPPFCPVHKVESLVEVGESNG